MKKKYRSNHGLRKRCGCARRTWDTCEHPWHFNCNGHRGSLGVSDRSDAKRLLAERRSAILSGTYTPPAAPTVVPVVNDSPSFATVADCYLTQRVEAKLSAGTAAHHTSLVAFLNGVIVPPGVPFTEKPFKLITLEDCEIAVAAKRVRSTSTITKNGKTWSRTTGGDIAANRMLAHLGALWTWAVQPKRAYAERSPFSVAGRVPEELKKTKERSRDRRLHTGEEDGLLTHAAPHLRDCIIAALETGMRKNELLSLQWKHVRWMQNEIALAAENTKTKTPREIPISPVLRTLLVRRQKSHPKDSPWKPEHFVFGNEIGDQVQSVRTAWDNAVLRAHGVKIDPVKRGRMSPENRATLREIDLHFHDLRHEAGSRKLEQGYPLHAVSRWLGHAKLSTTDVYLNATTQLLHELNERVPLTLVKR